MTNGKNTALSDLVYEQLKEMMLTRKLRCGDRIQEQELERELGVSRTPVREAVRRMSNEGIIKLSPNRHAEIITFNEDSIRDLGIIRITLDSLAVQLAIHNGSNKDFRELEQLSLVCDKAWRDEDTLAQIRADSHFHMKLVKLSRNQLLYDTQQTLGLRTLLLQANMLEHEPAAVKNIVHHGEILDALHNRDSEKALRAVQNHLCPFYHLDLSHINVLTFAP